MSKNERRDNYIAHASAEKPKEHVDAPRGGSLMSGNAAVRKRS